MNQHIDPCTVCGDFTLHDHPDLTMTALRWEIRENDFMDDLDIWEGGRQVAGHLRREDAERIINAMAFNAERQLPDLLRRMGDDLIYWRERAETAEGNLVIAVEALRDIGSRDILGSGIAWRALETIEGTDEEIAEAMERQRQPENQSQGER
jgi:hypothetical protein